MERLSMGERVQEILYRIAILMQNNCITAPQKNLLTSLLMEARRTRNFEKLQKAIFSLDEPEDFPNIIDEMIYYTCDNPDGYED